MYNNVYLKKSSESILSYLQRQNMKLKEELERLKEENNSLSEDIRYKDEELDEIKKQNNELKDDMNKVKGIISKY